MSPGLVQKDRPRLSKYDVVAVRNVLKLADYLGNFAHILGARRYISRSRFDKASLVP